MVLDFRGNTPEPISIHRKWRFRGQEGRKVLSVHQKGCFRGQKVVSDEALLDLDGKCVLLG